MIKLIVEITEVKGERNAINITYRTEEDQPTENEKFLEQRVSPALKEALNKPGLPGDRGQDP